MENNQNNIDNIFREKFENFAPLPPEQVWSGIEKGITVQATPGFLARYGKPLAAAAALIIILAAALWYFIPSGDTTSSFADEMIPDTQQEATPDSELINIPSGDTKDKEDLNVDTSTEIDLADNKSDIDDYYQEDVAETQIPAEETKETSVHTEIIYVESINTIGSIGRELTPVLPNLAPKSIPFENETDIRYIEPTTAPFDIAEEARETPLKKGNWAMGLYFSPEVILNDFDSVELLPTYSFNFEPTYYSSKHWFVRFGAGLSFTRDRGFAKVDYVSNDLMGSYDDVYDISFDSINGVPIPTYHTEKVDVWDSIPHVAISQITNNYLYLQAPLLFGYHNNINKNLRWYFYGGPAINLMIYQQIDEPSTAYANAKIVEVKNELPERSPYYMQMWLGAGIDFKATKNLSIALEPSYRYYFNHVFKEEPYKTSLSGFSFRIGLLYSIK